MSNHGAVAAALRHLHAVLGDAGCHLAGIMVDDARPLKRAVPCFAVDIAAARLAGAEMTLAGVPVYEVSDAELRQELGLPRRGA